MFSEADTITRQRLAKINELREKGIDPFPPSYHRTHSNRQVVTLLSENYEHSQSLPVVNVAGRVIAFRRMGKLSFIDLRDGTGKLQLYLRQDHLDEDSQDLIRLVDIGDFLGAIGRPMYTRTGEPSVDVSSLKLLAKSMQTLPEKWHGLADQEKRYRQRYLDLIANQEVAELFRHRAQIIAGVRSFLNGQGFLEVETPVLQPLAGGALAKPFVTHHNALGQDLYLRIALELHLKRLIIGGYDRVYEIGRVFRNEGIDSEHNPEFTLMECYQAYADYEDMMSLAEQLVACAAEAVGGKMQILFNGEDIDLTPPWPRISLQDAVLKYGGLDLDKYPNAASLGAAMARIGLEVDPKKDRGRLIDDILDHLVRPHFVQPVFLTDYPIEMSPLAKQKPGAPHLVERFEAFIGGIEIANAFTELNDPLEQERRFRSQLEEREATGDKRAEIDEDFIQALSYGMPPTGGLGMGMDRLVMLLTSQKSIREVILFPQLKEKR